MPEITTPAGKARLGSKITRTVALSATQDTMLAGLNATVQARNYGVSVELLNQNSSKALFLFDLSDIPANAVCLSANLRLYHSTAGTSGSFTLDLYSLAAANAGWPEGSKNGTAGAAGDCCWFYKDQATGTETAWAGSAGLATANVDYITPALAQITGNRADLVGTLYNFPLPPATVEAMFGPTGANYGFLVVASISTSGIASRSNANTALRPVLEITYQIDSIAPPPLALYVSPTGSDTTGDGSKDYPYATFAAANARANETPSVGVIYAEDGTYHETVTPPRAGLAYQAVNAGGAIITGDATRANAFYIDTCPNTSLRGLKITNTTGSGVFAIHSAGLRLQSCELYDCVDKGVFAQFSDGAAYVDCYAHGCSYGFEFEDSDDTIFARCWSYDNRTGYVSKTGTGNLFEACVAWNCERGFYFKASQNGLTQFCIAHNCSAEAVNITDNGGSPPPSSGQVFRNNIWANGAVYAWEPENDGSQTGMDADYNDLYNNLRAGRWNGIAITTVADWQTTSGQDTHSATTDPAWTDVQYLGFHLPPASPLRTAGQAGACLGPEGSTWNG